MSDPDTLKFYADNAATYVQHAQGPTPQLAGFLALLPPGGTVLELGTGNGRDAAAMLAAGFAVTPSDASPQLAAHAQARLGRPVRIMAFHQLDDIAIYDGVWACAALLHAPRDELTEDLARIYRATRRPSGCQLQGRWRRGPRPVRPLLQLSRRHRTADTPRRRCLLGRDRHQCE